MADNISFDFEAEIESSHLLTNAQQPIEPPDLPAEVIGQQPANYRKNFRKTVCTYWLRGLCMKGDACGFLHQFVSDRMPVCRNLLKYGECHDQDCPYKHSLDEIKECNMYKLGFCIYGPACRYKHIKNPGPPPDPEEVEAAKPREFRNINVVVNQVNPGVAREDERPPKRPRPFVGRGGERERDRAGERDRDRPLALPAPPPPAGGPGGTQAPMGAAPAGGGAGGGVGAGVGGRFDGELSEIIPLCWLLLLWLGACKAGDATNMLMCLAEDCVVVGCGDLISIRWMLATGNGVEGYVAKTDFH
ncbi:hypothetical protein Vretimale_13578 [Volvox reticuliferus]|uniref:C3H1-type domain-containing protein n=1 Tax=Volvox reticuliferus TaxID=1737510 RepID=A0A8J4GLJ9_9CHLO|nr:hypothetical protein Vretifemale_393 [Volvox reticuliferus]GIM09759.1 hypothetical protein Vretimale_13578 [Volvox reticuliferus]